MPWKMFDLPCQIPLKKEVSQLESQSRLQIYFQISALEHSLDHLPRLVGVFGAKAVVTCRSAGREHQVHSRPRFVTILAGTAESDRGLLVWRAGWMVLPAGRTGKKRRASEIQGGGAWRREGERERGKEGEREGRRQL